MFELIQCASHTWGPVEGRIPIDVKLLKLHRRALETPSIYEWFCYGEDIGLAENHEQWRTLSRRIRTLLRED